MALCFLTCYFLQFIDTHGSSCSCEHKSMALGHLVLEVIRWFDCYVSPTKILVSNSKE